MNPVNKVVLSTKNIAESVRDHVIKNVIASKGELRLDEASLRKLVNIIVRSSDEQIFRSLGLHEVEVRKSLKEVTEAVTTVKKKVK